ncbi:MAG: biotin--[acetyl-CoA-carboxylase] ligase [Wenzhouxiangella sp.]
MNTEHAIPAPLPGALDRRQILAQLESTRQPAPTLRIEREVDSTNAHLARLHAAGEKIDVLLAEAQSAGRGRRGRQWISPQGCGLYLSMQRSFAGPLRRLEALSLVAGLSAAAAIERCCGLRPGLKWPNDLQIEGRKLGGCLIDLAGNRQTSSAIIGIGINVDFRGQTGPDQPWTDLAAASGQPVDRNRLAGHLIEQLIDDLDQFELSGFGAMKDRWTSHDVLTGRAIEAHSHGQPVIRGQALGVDESGQLLVRTPDRLHRLHGAEVTLRTA